MSRLFPAVYEDLDDAAIRHHAAILLGDPDLAFDAEFDWASASFRLAAIETDIALNWLIGLRLAVKRYPTETADLIDQVLAIRRQMRKR